MSQTQQVADPGSNVLAVSQQKSTVGTSLLARTGTLLGLLSLAINLIWIIVVPPLRGPDEAAHLMAVMEVRTLGRLPEIHYDFSTDPRGVPVAPYDDKAVAAYAQQVGGVPPGAYEVRYESMQPPLYYMTAGLFAFPFPGDPQTVLLISKLVAALFGAFTIYFIWAGVRQLLPGEPRLAVLCAVCVALLPTFVYTSSSANNDSALNAVCAALFYVWFRGLREPKYDPYFLRAGALMGLGVLAKLTMVTLIPAFALVLIFRALDNNRDWIYGLRRLALFCITSAGAGLAVAGWWLVRNVVEYGEISGSTAALKWYSTHISHADLSTLAKIGEFCSTTFVSFIGVFGWEAALFPLNVYLFAEAVALALVVLSLAVFIRHLLSRSPSTAFLTRSFAIFGLATIGVIAGYVQFNVSVGSQPQARYLFALLLPISLGLLSGLYVFTHNMKKVPALVFLSILPCLLVVLNYMAIRLLAS